MIAHRQAAKAFLKELEEVSKDPVQAVAIDAISKALLTLENREARARVLKVVAELAHVSWGEP